MISWVGFDADDTLWHSEHHFMASHDLFCEIVRPFLDGADDPDAVARAHLAETEIANIPPFGYGLKGATLSMIETAMRVSDHRIDASQIQRLIDRAKEMAVHPVDLFDGVDDVLDALGGLRLALITKGDLLDQRRKIDESELATRFDAVEIIHEKNVATYGEVFRRHGIEPSRFVMIGNSIRSDVLPVLELGGWAILVPFADTWAHEQADPPLGHPRFIEVTALRDVVDAIARITHTGGRVD